MASNNTSLSSDTPPSPGGNPTITTYKGLEHPPNLRKLKGAASKSSVVKSLSIPVNDEAYGGAVPGFLHLPQDYGEKGNDVDTAAVLLSGAGGGVTGPSGIYVSMGSKLASLKRGVPVLRMDYRYPARDRPCCQDVISAMDYLQEHYPLTKFVLVGWSFGSAPVFTVGGSDSRVSGAACVAPQTAGTRGIRQLAPRPLLLLHGTGDRTLSPACSESLYESYGRKGDRTIKLFDNDNHALTNNSLAAEELLCDFIAKCAGVKVDSDEQEHVVRQPLVEGKQKAEVMERGGDLRGKEQIE